MKRSLIFLSLLLTLASYTNGQTGEGEAKLIVQLVYNYHNNNYYDNFAPYAHVTVSNFVYSNYGNLRYAAIEWALSDGNTNCGNAYGARWYTLEKKQEIILRDAGRYDLIVNLGYFKPADSYYKTQSGGAKQSYSPVFEAGKQYRMVVTIDVTTKGESFSVLFFEEGVLSTESSLGTSIRSFVSGDNKEVINRLKLESEKSNILQTFTTFEEMIYNSSVGIDEALKQLSITEEMILLYSRENGGRTFRDIILRQMENYRDHISDDWPRHYFPLASYGTRYDKGLNKFLRSFSFIWGMADTLGFSISITAVLFQNIIPDIEKSPIGYPLLIASAAAIPVFGGLSHVITNSQVLPKIDTVVYKISQYDGWAKDIQDTTSNS